MHQEGYGVLEAQVRHLVTYRDPTVFTKKCQKRRKKGVPPVFDREIDGVTYWGCVSARRALEGRFALPFRPPGGAQKRLLGVYSRVHPQAR